MRFGKKKNSDVPDTTSLISLSQYGQRRSSLCEVCPRSDRILMMELNRDGLITPPAARNTTAHYATSAYNARNTGTPLGLPFFKLLFYKFDILIIGSIQTTKLVQS